MNPEEKLELIKQVGEEIVSEEELLELLKTKKNLIAYDGFEPSGIAPIHFGLLRATNLKNMLKAGIKFKLYLVRILVILFLDEVIKLSNIETVAPLSAKLIARLIPINPAPPVISIFIVFFVNILLVLNAVYKRFVITGKVVFSINKRFLG